MSNSKWDVAGFKENLYGFLERCSLSVEELEKFFFMYYERLPLYYNDRLCYFEDLEKDFGYKKYTLKKSVFIKTSIDNIIGKGWLFEQKLFAIDYEASFKRFANIIYGYLRQPENIEPFYAVKLPDGKYYTSDGNRRIYGAYLLGINEVNIRYLEYAIIEK